MVRDTSLKWRTSNMISRHLRLCSRLSTEGDAERAASHRLGGRYVLGLHPIDVSGSHLPSDIDPGAHADRCFTVNRHGRIYTWGFYCHCLRARIYLSAPVWQTWTTQWWRCTRASERLKSSSTTRGRCSYAAWPTPTRPCATAGTADGRCWRRAPTRGWRSTSPFSLR